MPRKLRSTDHRLATTADLAELEDRLEALEAKAAKKKPAAAKGKGGKS